jgi:hypothetical protein
VDDVSGVCEQPASMSTTMLIKPNSLEDCPEAEVIPLSSLEFEGGFDARFITLSLM